MIKFKEALLEDAETIYEILKNCGLHLLQNEGIENWWPPYPLEKIIEDLHNKDKKVFLLTYNNIIAGTFMISSSPPLYYDSSIWGRNKNAIYPSKVAVLPEYRKLGIGKWCMNQIENLAIERKVDYIRLDVYEKNEYVIKLYKSLGYKFKGTAKTNRFNVVCLGKKIII
jgi:ribosomal protein S18 acetylase RimI-like enzyme